MAFGPCHFPGVSRAITYSTEICKVTYMFVLGHEAEIWVCSVECHKVQEYK